MDGYFGSIAALGVALFPLDAHSDPLFQRTAIGYLHTLSGGAFFLTLAFYSLYHFPKSGNKQHADALATSRNLVYRVSGIVILVSMSAMRATCFCCHQNGKPHLIDTTFSSGWNGSQSGHLRLRG